MTRRFRLWFCTLCLFPAALATGPAPVTADQPAPGPALRAALQPFVDRHELAGAVVLVADRDKVLALESVGQADVEKNSLMGPTALFWIASQSKPITAALLMTLVDEGKVGLDDPVEKYLPEFKQVRFEGRQPKTPITIRHLLSHTSGLPFRSKEEQPTLDRLTLKEAAESYARTPLESEPGTRYLYSNAGINTAGRVLEVVTGMPYETYLQKKLLDPLGMKDTTFWPTEEQLARLARSYRPDAAKTGLEPTTISQLQYPLDDRKRQPMPAGGLFSTATDVARFCRMMLNGGVLDGRRVLSEAAVKEMTRRQTPESVPTSYGLGWAVAPDGFGHGGAMATQMFVDTERGLVTVFLVQHSGFPGAGGRSYPAFREAARKAFPAE